MTLAFTLPALRRAMSFVAVFALAAPTLHAAPTKPARHAKAPAKSAQKANANLGPAYAERADVVAYAKDIAERNKLPAEWVAQQLAQARRIDSVRKLVMPPPAGTAKNYGAYRARFVEPRRVNAGLAWWRANETWLAQAEQRYGVPPEIVAAIVGVETFYGQYTGGFRIIDALSTLAFDFPPGRKDRSQFFRSELEAFFVMCAREGIEPVAVKGSFAGAMGLPQFMPSSVNRYAIDLDGNGHIDLNNSSADVVGSVANYLAEFGWQRGMPTHFGVAVPVDATDRATLLAPDILPSFTATQFSERGAVLDEPGKRHTGPLALIELQNGAFAPNYVAGTQNFYVVTRYNWSSYYAMAVIDLAQALRQQYAAAPR